MKSKTTAGLLALLLGGIGAHKFYLGRAGQGLLYLFFCWTFIPAFVGLIEAIVYFTMSEADFNRKYNATFAPQSQPVVVNVQNSAVASTGSSLSQQLRELHELRQLGVLSDAEFDAQKLRLLSSGT